MEPDQVGRSAGPIVRPVPGLDELSAAREAKTSERAPARLRVLRGGPTITAARGGYSTSTETTLRIFISRFWSSRPIEPSVKTYRQPTKTARAAETSRFTGTALGQPAWRQISSTPAGTNTGAIAKGKNKWQNTITSVAKGGILV